MASTSPTSRRAGQILAGAGALTAVAVVTALPFMLVWVAGNPLPGVSRWLDHLSADPGATLSQAWETATSRDDGSLFLQILTLGGWVASALAAWAWTSFLIAFIAELTAQLSAVRRGRVASATRLRGMRMQQRAAAALVAAIIGVFAAPALASAATVLASSTAGTVAHTAPTPAGGAQAPRTESPAAAHVVQRGEGLLDIAARYGVPWQQLAEANYGTSQPGGQALQPGSTRVYPGWTLTIPGVTAVSSSTTQAAPSDAAAAPTVYKIARGDRLHDVAERFLGDGDRYTEIAKKNPTLEKQDHRFPDHIEAGWRIILPDDAKDRGPAAHATGRMLPATPPGVTDDRAAPTQADDAAATTEQHDAVPPATAAPRPATNAPGATASTNPSPADPESTPPTPPVQASPSADAPATGGSSQVAPAASTTASDGDNTDVDTAVVLGSLAGAGLLSTLLLTRVLRNRRRQQQHRRPGRQLPHPQAGATERALRVAEEPADVDRLDAALRSLAAAVADREPTDVPDIAAAWIVDQDVTVVLTQPCVDPPAPWTRADDHAWILAGGAVPPPAFGQLAPLPTLVAVGSQPGRHLLIDLERLGSITIAGDPDRGAALLRYLASELACNTWSDDVEVIIAGFPASEAELLVALNPDRMRAVSSVTETASRLRRRVGTVRAALSAAGVSNTFTGRSVDVGESWAPQVLLVVDPGEEDLAALVELQRDIGDTGRCAIAVASASPAARQDCHTLVIGADGILDLRLPWLTVTTQAAGLPVRELQPLAEIMQQARATADVPTPAAPEPEAWAADADANGALMQLFESTEAAAGDAWDEHSAAAAPTRQEPTAGHGAQPESLTEQQPILALPPITLPTTAPRREVTAAIRQRRRQSDPQLDSDLRAWKEQDPTRPRIGVLGQVTVAAPGPAPDQRRRFHAEIIVYLAARGARGASAEQFTEALWPTPGQAIKDASRRVAISRARRWLGQTAEGQDWLPEMGADRLYRLQEGYLLDWHLFRRLRTRGEAHGPAGVKDLRAALELVRGTPFDGADRAYAAGARNPYTWLPESDVYPGHLVSGIVDTAHQLAELYLDAGDTAGARWAIGQAWLADLHRGDDGPWRDLLRAAQMDGHAAEIRNLLSELMREREAEVPEDLTKETYAWLRPLLPEVLAGSS
ncbi:LysM peptidoglycan-binding domain-containing protein (plasmid) [Micromonospora zamorensis]|uniref:LysM peptidoglycan-binding domain-containing protein n=1 Tax=Micromonospora zamorensis TaxID=709883 RepID=UPI002E1B62EA